MCRGPTPLWNIRREQRSATVDYAVDIDSISSMTDNIFGLSTPSPASGGERLQQSNIPSPRCPSYISCNADVIPRPLFSYEHDKASFPQHYTLWPDHRHERGLTRKYLSETKTAAYSGHMAECTEEHESRIQTLKEMNKAIDYHFWMRAKAFLDQGILLITISYYCHRLKTNAPCMPEC